MKKFVAVFVSTLTVAALLLVGCTKEGEPRTVESIVSSNDDVAATIQNGADEAGVNIDIKDNTISYSYDISIVDGVTDEMIEDEDFIKSIETSIGVQKNSLAKVCKTIEKKANIEGVIINVLYTYNDKEVAGASFTSADLDAEEASSEAEKADSEAEETDE